jgi:hypothetical protein
MEQLNAALQSISGQVWGVPLVALIALSGAIDVITRKYLREKAQGLHRPYKQTYIN